MQTDLSQVVWIGGSTDAGKTSVARMLAAKHGWQEYHYDRFDRLEWPGHWARIDPIRHPHLDAARGKTRDAAWVETTLEEMVAEWLRSTPERFALTLEDLRALPATPPIVAEGYGFLPDLVRPLLSSPRQAIWLVSTEAFKRASYERRGKGRFADTSDPERARRNHVGRDLLLATEVRRQAVSLGLTVVEIDGTRPLQEITSLVEEHFAPYLALSGAMRRPRSMSTVAVSQLALIREVSEILQNAGIAHWLFGGWAVDFVVGAVTREHEDIEFIAWKHDFPAVRRLLEERGYAPLYQRGDGAAWRHRGQRVELDFIERRRDGMIITSGWDDWPWPADAFKAPIGHLGDVVCPAVSAAAQLETKELYGRYRPGRELREKDRQDIGRLRRVIGSAPTSPSGRGPS